MTRYWSSLVHELEPYVPGEQPQQGTFIKLNTNENPYPPSPAAVEAIRREAGGLLNRYPEPESTALREAVADVHGVPADCVFPGNGSDEILAHVFCALLKHGAPLLFPDVTYSFYPVYCRLYGIDYRTVPLDDSLAICPEDYAVPNGGVILPNPNAPTGRLLSLETIGQLAAGSPDSVVVVDEAYIDFGGDSATALIDRHDNLLVTQTLSKSRGLAGLRVGYAVGQRPLIEALERVKNSFNSYPVDRLAQAGAVAALADRDYFEQTRHAIITGREFLARELGRLGFEVLPSHANFVFCRHPEHGGPELLAGLRERGILVRHSHHPRIRDYLRISVGTRDECEAVVAALREILTARSDGLLKG